MYKCFFIEINSFDENISLAFNLANEYKKIYFSFWFYPEIEDTTQISILNKFKNNFIGMKKLVPMTYYNDEKVDTLKSNILFLYDGKSKKNILDNINEIKKNCDSILFYLEDDSNWLIGEIFHEKILLVKQNSKMKDYLINSDNIFSDKPPSWW